MTAINADWCITHIVKLHISRICGNRIKWMYCQIGFIMLHMSFHVIIHIDTYTIKYIESIAKLCNKV